MTKRWLAFFIIGALFGRVDAVALNSLDLRVVVALVGIFGLVISLQHRAFGVVAVIGGAFWGLAHSAPPLPPSLRGETLRVEMTSGGMVLAPGASASLLAKHDVMYEAYGKALLGGYGRAQRGHGSRPLFAPARMGLRLPGDDAAAPLAGFKAGLSLRLQRAGGRLAPYFAGILLADKRRLSPRMVDAFRRAGLVHLLAASGLHVTMIMTLMTGLLRLPFLLAYGLRLMSPERWRRATPLLSLVASMGATAYLALTGAPVAAQRAVLSYVLLQVARVFIGIPPLARRLQWTALAQTLLFPVGFVSEGVLMSWGAYLLVVDASQAGASDDRHRTWRVPLPCAPRRTRHSGTRYPPSPVHLRTSSMRRALFLQARLLTLATAAYGQASPAALIANLALVPVFVLLLPSAVALTIWPSLPGRHLLLVIHRTFAELVAKIADLTPAPADLPAGVRAAAAAAAVAVLLNTCRRLSIRVYEGR